LITVHLDGKYNGFAKVELKGKKEMIDKTGKTVIRLNMILLLNLEKV
jgi:hypothetical protein